MIPEVKKTYFHLVLILDSCSYIIYTCVCIAYIFTLVSSCAVSSITYYVWFVQYEQFITYHNVVFTSPRCNKMLHLRFVFLESQDALFFGCNDIFNLWQWVVLFKHRTFLSFYRSSRAIVLHILVFSQFQHTWMQ